MLLRIAASAVALALVCGCAPPEPPPKLKPSDGFAAPKDKAFIDDAVGRINAEFTTPDNVVLRDLYISATPGQPRALCVDAALPGERWTGFVVVEDTPMFMKEQDTLSAKARPVCRVLAKKYLGERLDDWAAADLEINQSGCAHLDVQYWGAHKRYCYGAPVRPTPAS